MRYTTVKRVVELRAFDLKRAPGVKGFTLARARAKEPKPQPTRYLLQQGRFVKQPQKRQPGGCR